MIQHIIIICVVIMAICAALTTAAQLGFIGPADITINTPTGEARLGPAVVMALKTGGIEQLQAQGFPRATAQAVEVWGLEVSGNWEYIRIYWEQGSATLITPQGTHGIPPDADVMIYTGPAIAGQLYALADTGEFSLGWLDAIPWFFTGISPTGYKGAIQEWAGS